eukprot:4516263-Pyramimonas_sp.AAC.1
MTTMWSLIYLSNYVTAAREILHSVHGLAFHAVGPPPDWDAVELLPMPIAYDDNREIKVRSTVIEEPVFLKAGAEVASSDDDGGDK